MKFTRIFSAILIFLTLLFSCTRENTRRIENYKSITKNSEKILIAILEVNTPGFFLKNGLPTGYHFELLRDYAIKRGFKLKIVPFESIETSVALVKSGKVDILAIENNSIKNSELQKTIPHWRVHLSLISAFKELPSRKSTIYIPDNLLSKEELSIIEQNYDGIHLVDPMNIGLVVEAMFNQKNTFAIVQSALADGICIKYPNVNIQDVMESTSNSWYVAKKCRYLFDLNAWIADKRNSKSHSIYYSSFYQNRKVNRTLTNGINMQGDIILSPYDDLVKKYSKKIGWDWLLVSALIYQESKFNAHVESEKGAKGLMQVMPATANLFGFEASHSIASNVYIGTRLLSRLTTAFSKYPIPIEERNKFVLAAYNGGIGNIIDAMKLTSKYGYNPYSWDVVSQFLRFKNQPKYYKDKVSRFGIFNNNETTRFVVEILDRYQFYKALTLS